MEQKEKPSIAAVEPGRPWRKPVLREEDYSMTESSPTAIGTDLGISS